MRKVQRGLAAVMVVAAFSAMNAIGCIGGGCGVGPVPGPNTQGGTVVFDALAIGATEELTIPVQDSADVDETITGASLEGVDASQFKVRSSFPIDVPAGQQASVVVEFAPTAAGTAKATLVLQTAGMGPSPIPLEGTATATGR